MNARTLGAVINRDRFLTVFAPSLSRARELYVERRRGRPSNAPRLHGMKAAVEYGVDITLLEHSLRLTPAERLRRLDDDVAFSAALSPRLCTACAFASFMIRSPRSRPALR